MKQSALPYLACLASFIAVLYAADTKLTGLIDDSSTATSESSASPEQTIYDFPLTVGSADKMHRLLGSSLELLKEYEAIEEEPERQEGLFKLCQTSTKYMGTLCSIWKTGENLYLADLIFSRDKVQHTGNFADPRLASIISDVYEGKTSSNSKHSLEERRIIARNMMEFALLQMKDLDTPPEIFLNYLQVADAEQIRLLCSKLLGKLREPKEPNDKRNLWSWCFAMTRNPNVHIAFLEPSVFEIYNSDCYMQQDFCTNDELHKMMMAKFKPHLTPENALRSASDVDKRLDHKLRKTDFNTIIAAFKQFKPSRGRNFGVDIEKDRIALEEMIFTTLQDKILESRRGFDPRENKEFFSKLLSQRCVNVLVLFLDYKPYDYLKIYSETAETDENQIIIYEAYRHRESTSLYDNNLVNPTKTKVNLLLSGLIHVPYEEENWNFWRHFPKVHVTLLPKRRTEKEEEEKEKEKEDKEEKKEDKEEKKKGHYYVKQDMNVVYRDNYFAKSVDDKIFAEIYGATLEEGQPIGKQLVMFVLKNALTNYSGTDRISNKLRHFLIVADTEDVSRFCSVLSGIEGNDYQLRFWKQHCVNLKLNPHYIAVLVQPALFGIVNQKCFKAEDGCTDRDLRAILTTLRVRSLYLYKGSCLQISFQRLSMERISEILKRMALTMGTYMNLNETDHWEILHNLFPPLRLLMEPVDPKEAEELNDIHPLIDFPLEGRDKAMSESERRILRSITDQAVVEMIMDEYDDLKKDPKSGDLITKDFITRDFAVNILDWMIKTFLRKLPDHFLADTLEQAKLSPTCESEVREVARYRCLLDPYLSGKQKIHGTIVNLVMSEAGNFEPIVKAHVVAEAAGITNPMARQKIAELLAKYPEEILLKIFTMIDDDEKYQFHVIQPQLSGIKKISLEGDSIRYSISNFDDFIDADVRSDGFKVLSLAGKMKMTSKYVVDRLKHFSGPIIRIVTEFANESGEIMRWNSAEDWAALERALIQNDPKCYEAVELNLSELERGFVTEIPSINYNRYASFKEVEAAVREKIKPILEEQLGIEYAKKYESGPLAQVVDSGLKAVVFFNQPIFEKASKEDQSYKQVIAKAFLDHTEWMIGGDRNEIRRAADLVVDAISKWHHIFTETKFGLSVDFSDKNVARSCLLYVLLEINNEEAQQSLPYMVNDFLGHVGMEVNKKVMEQGSSTITKMVEASMRDPAARIALMQPKLNVSKPWSLAELCTAIAEKKVPSEFFPKILAIAPIDLIFRAFRSHAREKKDFFDPESESDWKQLEAIMVKLDDDRVLATMKAGDLPFFPTVRLTREDYDSYKEVFDEIKDTRQTRKTF